MSKAVWMALVVLLGVAPVSRFAQQDRAEVASPGDTLAVVPANASLSNSEIAVEISRGTPRQLPVGRVLIARDDAFADALASGVLQAAAPLLLVPRVGPIPGHVIEELQRLSPAEVVILGGEAAVDSGVATELMSYTDRLTRLAGSSRYETAVQIAEQIPSPDTVILARAFGSAGAAPSQGFADALGAGGLAASKGWPVVLTDTSVLTGVTADYLAESGASTVLLVGGTAAISEQVAAQVQALGIATERIAGPDRFTTAIGLVKAGGTQSAADVARVTLVEGADGEAWAGGFAAAGHAAVTGSPIVLASSDEIPAPTRSFLANGIGTGARGATAGGTSFAQDAGGIGVSPGVGEIVITCVIGFTTCEEARRITGLPASPLFAFSPVPGAPVSAGQEVSVQVDPAALAAGQELFFDSECFGLQQTAQLDSQARAALTAPADVTGGCDVIVSTTLTNGQFGGVFAFFPEGDGTGPTDAITLSYWIFSDSGPLDAPLALDVRTTCGSDPIGTPARTGRVHHAQFAAEDGAGASTSHILQREGCTTQALLPPETTGATWSVTSTFAGGQTYASGNGSTASFDLAAIPAELGNVLLAFNVELSSDAPTAAQPLPGGQSVMVRVLRTGLAVSCSDGSSGDGTTTYELVVPDGTTCTVTATVGTVVLSQVGAPFIFAPEAAFTADSTLGDVLILRI